VSVVTVDRSRLPQPGPVQPFTFPPIAKSSLPNGLRVWTIHHSQVPMVALILLVRCGAAADPRGKEGLAALTADMLDEGAGGLAAIQLHEELAKIGAQFDTDIGSDATVLSVTALSRFAPRALALLADIAVRPLLAAADFTRVRQLRLHRLTQLRDLPSAVADRAFISLLYGDHPYGHAPIGSERTLAALTPDDVQAFHRDAIRPAAATLVAVGDCDHREVHHLAEAAFGGWTGPDRQRDVEADSFPRAPRLVVVPRPGAPQSELRIGHVAAPRSTPDYHALVAANMVLGGQFVSRINLNLREDKGFTYGARTAFDFRKLPGPFALQVSVHTAATARAIEESIGEIAAIRGPRPVSPEELALSVAALTRGYARNFETADQIARAATQLALYDLPDDYFSEFVPLVEKVTADDVTRVAARHLDLGRLTTVIVGDLDAIGADLSRLDAGAPVILAADTI
jgi:predicted Zn-dependent peptidase